MKYFLDTNICIYYLKGKYDGIKQNLLSKHPDEIKIPSIVKAELLLGAEKSVKKKEVLTALEEFLLPFEVRSFGEPESHQYAHIRASLEDKGSPIGPNDLIIASIVIENNGILVTNNEKEFGRIENLVIENWAK